MANSKRNLVFISHATPEDNTFVMWLSTRLKLLGYEVWSDVTKLFGGEKWWDEIEEAIDLYTVKFVLVITKTSLSKPGVIKEVELGLNAEKKHELARFIIPIIIDDSVFSGQPYDISERNIITFSQGWALGLTKLKKRLQYDDVPVQQNHQNLGEALSAISNSGYQVVERDDEFALSNELLIERVPSHLNFYRLPGSVDNWKNYLAGCPHAWFQWSGLLVSFASKEIIQQYLPSHIHASLDKKLDLNAALNHQPREFEKFEVREVINQVSYLISKAWNNHMRNLGLRPYILANGFHAWYFPLSDDIFGKLKFADIDGVSRNKQIVGYSAKNKLYWHYAVEIKPSYGHKPKIQLIPHVVFTEDGEKSLSDKAKMHQMRRRFCRSWWNPRWRDMLLVYLNQVSMGESMIKIDLGSSELLIANSRPEYIESDYVLSAIDFEVVDDVDEDVDLKLDNEQDMHDE